MLLAFLRDCYYKGARILSTVYHHVVTVLIPVSTKDFMLTR